MIFNIASTCPLSLPDSTELVRDGSGFDSRWEQCKNRASCPLQGTANGVPSLNDLAVDAVKHNQQTNRACYMYLKVFSYRYDLGSTLEPRNVCLAVIVMSSCHLDCSACTHKR